VPGFSLDALELCGKPATEPTTAGVEEVDPEDRLVVSLLSTGAGIELPPLDCRAPSPNRAGDSEGCTPTVLADTEKQEQHKTVNSTIVTE